MGVVVEAHYGGFVGSAGWLRLEWLLLWEVGLWGDWAVGVRLEEGLRLRKRLGLDLGRLLLLLLGIRLQRSLLLRLGLELRLRLSLRLLRYIWFVGCLLDLLE